MDKKSLLDMTIREIIEQEGIRLVNVVASFAAQLDEMEELVLEDSHLNKKSPDYTKGDEDAPFFSEAYLYALLGKEDARSVLGRLRRLRDTLTELPPGVKEMKARLDLEKAVETFFSDHPTKESRNALQSAWLELDSLRAKRQHASSRATNEARYGD